MANISYVHRQPPEAGAGDPGTAHEPGPPGGPSAQDTGLELRHLVNIIWRRKFTILATTLILTTLAALAVFQATPLYVAESRLVVEQQRERALNFEEVLQGGNFDFYTNQTEAAVLASRSLATKAVEALNLVNHPLFNPELAPPAKGPMRWLFGGRSWRETVKGWLPEWLRVELVGGGDPAPPLSPQERARRLKEAVIDQFLFNLEVLSSERSRVLQVQFTAADPDLAARAANTIAEIYINETVLRKFEANSRATDWLDQQVSDLRAALETSRKALEEHRRRIGYVDLSGQANLLGQQLAQLSAELVKSRTARAEAEARFLQVQKLLESATDIESAGSVLDSQLIQRLREQEAEVSRALAELRTQLGERHPRLRLKRNELADLQERITLEVAKIATNLGNEAEIAAVREDNLAVEVESLKKLLEQQNDQLVTLRALESEVRANNEIYQAILTRFKETDVQEQSLQQADARLISAAVPPAFAAYPKKALITAVAFVISTMLGVMLVFVIENLDSGFRSLSQLEAASGLAAIGLIPSLTGFGLRRRAPEDVVIDRPNTAYAEAIRSLRTTLLLSSRGDPPKTVIFTSSMPGEGKTSVAVSLARTAARAGQRTVVVDADLRRPALHKALDVANLAGLAEHLAGDSELEEIIEIDARSGLHYITAGHGGADPSSLLGSERMVNAIERLKLAYDLVILDSPPVLAVSDTLVLLRRIDKTVFLVRWGETQREAALAGIRMARDAHANFAGLALTQVDLKKHARYSYGSSGYYYGAYRKYYDA